MANSYFKFRKFTIHQHKTAMKVCTDACLFGALVAHKTLNSKRFLDIGTGTGLLSLMVAQKNETATIDAVELEANAAEQSLENITASSWKDRINILHTDILSFEPEKPYDLIFSNPPFYQNDLKSPDPLKNNAKHNSTLDLDQLIGFTSRHLSNDGQFAVLLPYRLVDEFITGAAGAGLYLNYQMLVKQTLKHKFFRGIMIFSKNNTEPVKEELIIRNPDNNYSPEFAAYLKDYYLFL